MKKLIVLVLSAGFSAAQWISVSPTPKPAPLPHSVVSYGLIMGGFLALLLISLLFVEESKSV
ncbi:hypothetical protein HUU53_02960 [Candidatus Micrarchaeota archaeon]|nr:hypothetical protein [Candidatus Micrarchaeota archaeon]